MRRAALAGVLIEVGVRGREELYGASRPRPAARTATPPSPSSPAATPPPTRPATAEDFAAWSGLPAADVRRAWQDPEPPAGEPDEGPVRLLPAFDEWLLGWASRDLVLPERHAGEVLRGGIIRAVAIADGRVFATWRRGRGGRSSSRRSGG